ncbi:hypothetical protein MHU86_23303 [Fragilaria crotonensis]|nr:hypothetical protein MHU86_23303 [Fragilaria crotonensis]
MIRRFQDKTRSPRRLELSRQPLREDQILHSGDTSDLQGRSASNRSMGGLRYFGTLCMVGTKSFHLDNDNERKLACWLGPAEDYGGGDAAFLLPKSAKPIVRSTFWALTPDERADRREEIAELLESIEEKIGISGQTRRWRKSLVKISFLVDIFGDLNDATEDGGEFRRSDADDYTPEALISTQLLRYN